MKLIRNRILNNPRLGNCLLVFSLLFCGAVAQADVYKWYDSEGNVNYGEHPPQGINAKLFLKTSGTSKRTPAPAGHHQSIRNYLDSIPPVEPTAGTPATVISGPASTATP